MSLAKKYAELAELVEALDQTEKKMLSWLKQNGYDIHSPKYDAAPKKRRKKPATKKAKRNRVSKKPGGTALEELGFRNFRTLKALKGRFASIESLRGVSKAGLAKIKWVGPSGVVLLERLLKKHKINLTD